MLRTFENLRRLFINSGLLTEEVKVANKEDGLGFDIIIFTREHNSAHAIISRYGKKPKKIGEFFITSNLPKTSYDIIPYRCNIPLVIRTKIVAWANNDNNWKMLQDIWRRNCISSKQKAFLTTKEAREY